MPKLSDETLSERRQHILEAAYVCFATKGFQGTTIEDVKRQAGVSTGAIYTYFASKEEMMRALLEEARDRRRQRLEEAAERAAGQGDPAEVLLRWVAGVAGTKGRQVARFDVNLWAEALRNPRIGKLARAAIREATKATARAIDAKLEASGVAAPQRSGAAASLVIAMYLGLEVQNAVGMKLDVDGMDGVLRALLPDAFGEPNGQ